MKLNIEPGTYVVAVSGGVDSVVLLDLLSRRPGLKLIVAHFNHGIRSDSAEDEKLVKRTARNYGLKFEATNGQLGVVSEEIARKARYVFLEAIKAKYQAQAIITAHHQDDLIETTMINLLRGTGRQGLSSIINNQKIIRPLLNVSKQSILEYAHQHNLEWQEDSTNQNPDYLRNYLRLKVLMKLNKKQREILICNIEKVAKINNSLDNEFAKLSHNIGQTEIDRQAFSKLPAEVGTEYMAYLLRQCQIKDYDSTTINRLSLSIKTSKPNTAQPIRQLQSLKLTAATATIATS
ncbi:tRNA lysidine(34) synthetase TilS [Candidatus Saccharibacteria bacterium]|nr:tRNA lysidine(34) synthetase TilS [Candidatus Saccharibacteria bacterium]